MKQHSLTVISFFPELVFTHTKKNTSHKIITFYMTYFLAVLLNEKRKYNKMSLSIHLPTTVLLDRWMADGFFSHCPYNLTCAFSSPLKVTKLIHQLQYFWMDA